MRGLLLALLLAAPAGAQRTGEVGFTIEKWGGIDTQHDSARISDFDAQDADNVLTDNDRLEKRTGNVRLTTILSGHPVKALREFVPANLTRYVIAHASTTVYQTDLSGTVTALSTVTANANVDMVQALNKLIVQDGQGNPWSWDVTSTATLSGMPVCKYMEYLNERVYCGNIPSQSTSRVAVSSYGSTSYFTVPANVSAVGEAPNTFDFQREDGDSVTCLKATRCGVFVGKGKSTHILKGFDNFTFRKDVISENIGCQDDRSVQTIDGKIVWLGQDAIYEWSCAGAPVPISRDIDPIIKSLRQGNSFSASWVLNSQGDFESGTLNASGPGAALSASIVTGSVVPSSSTLNDNTTGFFSQGSCAGCGINPNGYVEFAGITSTYTLKYEGTVLPASDGWTKTVTGSAPSEAVSGGVYTASFVSINDNIVLTQPITNTTMSKHFVARAYLSDPGSNVFTYVGSASGATGSSSPESPHVDIRDTVVNYKYGATTVRAESADTTVFSTYTIIVTTGSAIYWYRNGVFKASATATTAYADAAFSSFQGGTGTGAGSGTSYFDFHYTASGVSPNGASDIVAVSTYTSRIFNTTFSTPVVGAFTVSSHPFVGTTLSYSVRSSTSPNNDLWGSYQSVVNPSTPTSVSQYFQYRATFTALNLVESPGFSRVQLAATTTGYYFSPIKFVGIAISTYGSFDALETLPAGGQITYAVRQGTYSFPPETTSIAWTAISNRATVPLSVSTPTYFQYRALFSPATPDGSQQVQLDRSQLSWTEGQFTPPVSSGWKDGRYFMCATVSTTTSYPDTCLVYQRNKKWVTFSGFSAASLASYNRDLIVGSGSNDGYVWKMLQNDIYNDDGAAIASTWISKDFMFAPNGRDWPTGDKAINEIWLDTEVSSSTYLSVGYAINKSSSYISGSLDLGAWGDSVNRIIQFSSFGHGKYSRVKLYNADLDKAIKVNAYSVYGEPNPKTQD